MSNVLSRSTASALNTAWLAPYARSLLRIAAGLAFLEHGTGKLLGFPAGLPFIDKMPPGLMYFTGTMELVGGLLIVLGLFTRPVAFILSGFHGGSLFHGAFPEELLRPRSTWASPQCFTASFSFISPPPAPAHGRSTGIDDKLGAARLDGQQLAALLAPPAAPEEQGGAREHHEPSGSFRRSGRAGVAIDRELQ